MALLTRPAVISGLSASSFPETAAGNRDCIGCLPFKQKIRKFRFEVKWKGNFPENLFGSCGQPPEIVLFFRSERNSRNALTICENRSVSRPFLTRLRKYAEWNAK